MIEEMKNTLQKMPTEIRKECEAVLDAIELMDANDAYRLWKRLICTLENRFDESSRTFVTKSAEWIMHYAQIDYAGQVANILGAMYYSGEIGTQSYKEAVKYYQIAESLGDLTACENLGYCYYYGRDLEIDYEKAFQYFTKVAITTGSLIARYKLGDMYAYGHYVAKDENVAFLIYQNCYMDAQEMNLEEDLMSDLAYRLGHCFHTGIGVEIDELQAEDFLRIAYDSLLNSGLTDEISRSKLRRIMKELEEIRDENEQNQPAHLS